MMVRGNLLLNPDTNFQPTVKMQRSVLGDTKGLTSTPNLQSLWKGSRSSLPCGGQWGAGTWQGEFMTDKRNQNIAWILWMRITGFHTVGYSSRILASTDSLAAQAQCWRLGGTQTTSCFSFQFALQPAEHQGWIHHLGLCSLSHTQCLRKRALQQAGQARQQGRPLHLALLPHSSPAPSPRLALSSLLFCWVCSLLD